MRVAFRHRKRLSVARRWFLQGEGGRPLAVKFDTPRTDPLKILTLEVVKFGKVGKIYLMFPFANHFSMTSMQNGVKEGRER